MEAELYRLDSMRRIALPVGLVLLLVGWALARRSRVVEFAPDWATAEDRAVADGCWIVAHIRRDDRAGSRALDELLDTEVACRALRDATGERFVHVRLESTSDHAIVTSLAGPATAVATLVVQPNSTAAPTDPADRLVGRLDGFVELNTLCRFLADADAMDAPIRASAAALRANPNDHAAALALAEPLLALGALDRVERLLTAILGSTPSTSLRESAAPAEPPCPDDPSVRRALELRISLFLRRGQIEHALETRRELARRYPPAPSAIDADRTPTMPAPH